MTVSYHLAMRPAELEQIIDLQNRNHVNNLSAEQRQREGFVTLRHDMNLLNEISGQYHHVIARDGHKVVGYALTMLKEYQHLIPSLLPMFERVNSLTLNETPINQLRYVMMGQICIDQEHRGRNIANGLYQKMKIALRPHFDMIVTEIATSNERSLLAHQKVGFKIIDQHLAENSEEWKIVAWDWRQ